MPDTPVSDDISMEFDETAIGSVRTEERPEAEEGAASLGQGILVSDRYQLEECLGEGGMGLVYRAEHVLMKKAVAIKVLHPELTRNAEVVARFKREAQAAANIEHPNVCQATDFGQTDDGAFFLVMEYLEGRTLQSVIEDEGSLSPRRAAAIAQQICAALAQAHDAGVVHRDLKPENIMLIEREGNPDFVKIMDFGIARINVDDTESNQTPARLTKAGMVYGTPHYMSPEQVVGGDVDARSDLYALGAVVFEMVTGRLPFESKNLAAIMGMHVTQRPPVPGEIAPEAGIPRSLDALIGALLEKAPEKRPQSAEEVRKHLAAVIEDIDRPPSRLDTTRVRTAAMPVLLQAEKIGRPLVERSKEYGLSAYQQFMALPMQTRSIVAGAAGAVLILTLLLAWAIPGAPPEVVAERTATTLTEERARFLEAEEVATAIAKAADGNLDALHELRGKDPRSPHLAYQLALHHADANRWDQALVFYDEAVDLEKRYIHDPRLNEDLFTLITGRNAGQADEAIKFVLRHPSPVAMARLEEMAREGSTRQERKRAYDALKESGHFDKAEKWSRAAMELRQASGCNEHKERLEVVVKIGDPRALGAVEGVSRLPTRGCGLLKQQDCYACIRGDLRQAIETLSQKK